MGYFPNGTSGMIFEEEFCDKCIHRASDKTYCAVMSLHQLYTAAIHWTPEQPKDP